MLPYSFIYSLFTMLLVAQTTIIASNNLVIVSNELEKCGRKRSCPELSYCPDLCVEYEGKP
jgi:hypothetical protein